MYICILTLPSHFQKNSHVLIFWYIHRNYKTMYYKRQLLNFDSVFYDTFLLQIASISLKSAQYKLKSNIYFKSSAKARIFPIECNGTPFVALLAISGLYYSTDFLLATYFGFSDFVKYFFFFIELSNKTFFSNMPTSFWEIDLTIL